MLLTRITVRASGPWKGNLVVFTSNGSAWNWSREIFVAGCLASRRARLREGWPWEQRPTTVYAARTVCCTVLYCTVLYCTVLYCTVQTRRRGRLVVTVRQARDRGLGFERGSTPCHHVLRKTRGRTSATAGGEESVVCLGNSSKDGRDTTVINQAQEGT